MEVEAEAGLGGGGGGVGLVPVQVDPDLRFVDIVCRYYLDSLVIIYN